MQLQTTPGFEERPEDLFEEAPCGFLSTRPDGTFLQVNHTFLEWTGYSREELLAGKRFQDVLSVGGKIFHETHYAPLLRMQGFAREINFELRCKDGQPLPVLLNTTVKKDAEGKPVLYRLALFPITDRKNYERELLLARKKAEEAAKAKADFLSMMSHEIRTPMNAIIGLSNLLQQTVLAPEQQKFVHILNTSSENLLGLLNNILDFSKIEAGKVSLEERTFNLRQLVYTIFHGLNVKAEEKKLALRVEIEPGVPASLIGDPVKIGQVLTNLLGNAIKFTEHGSVTVSVRARELSTEAASLEFRVTDTGIGIPPERLANVFEEFTQASYDINLKYGGTGLGLTISQRLLAMYGSKLNVESTLGEGTSFSFPLYLRIGQDTEETGHAVESILNAQTLRGLRVLVAEDNSVNVFVISQFLRRWGVDFDVVENGRQAIEKLRERDYELVLMDLQMPEMDGYEATRLLRSLPDERFHRLPILALTASARIGLEDRMDAVGFSDFVGKPFKPEDLFAKLALHGSRHPAPAAVEAPTARTEPPRPPAPAPEPQETPRRFDFEKFNDLAEGDSQVLVELLTLAVQNCEKCKHDVAQALEKGDREAFEFIAHRMKMILELMQPLALKAALQHSRELLADAGRSEAHVRATIEVIHRELDALIEAIQEEARKVASTLYPVDGASASGA